MNKNIFQIMVELQHQFNKQVAEDYLDKNFNWNSAIIAESGELLESLGYKWWKKQEPDIENVKVEAIDLLHFVISDRIQKNKKMFSEKESLNMVSIEFYNEFNTNKVLNDHSTLEDMIFYLIATNSFRLNVMKRIFTKLNMSNEDVYISYITKNCLNKFRQDNGYKDGSYIKNWNGREDNAVAFEIANDWGADEDLFEQLYLDLETYYKEEVLHKSEAPIFDKPDFFRCNELN